MRATPRRNKQALRGKKAANGEAGTSDFGQWRGVFAVGPSPRGLSGDDLYLLYARDVTSRTAESAPRLKKAWSESTFPWHELENRRLRCGDPTPGPDIMLFLLGGMECVFYRGTRAEKWGRFGGRNVYREICECVRRTLAALQTSLMKR